MNLHIPAEIQEAIASGAHLVVSVSGGKDSDAMLWALVARFPELIKAGRMHAVHADLGRAELKATPQHVVGVAARAGVPLHIVRHGRYDLLDGIKNRMATRPGVPPWPSSDVRQCTSDWKRDPIDKWIRNTFNGPVIVAMGLRAEESLTRARKPEVAARSRASSAERPVLDWLPIHHWTIAHVWAALEGKGHHEAYDRGNDRVSCALCVLASGNDLLNGAMQDPDLFQAYCDVEIASGFSFQNKKWLGLIAPHLLRDDQRAFYASKTKAAA